MCCQPKEAKAKAIDIFTTAELFMTTQYTPSTDDGKRPSLTCATSAGKILVHCPHASGVRGTDQIMHGESDDDGGPRFLSMNRKVSLGFVLGSIDAGAEPIFPPQIITVGTIPNGLCLGWDYILLQRSEYKECDQGDIPRRTCLSQLSVGWTQEVTRSNFSFTRVSAYRP